MNIKILHIDDEQDVLTGVKAVVNGHKIGACTLQIVDSCNFEGGLVKLEENDYDLVILDLCVGKAANASDKVGQEVFEQIRSKAFIPIVFFTGLPDFVKDLQSSIVKVAGKGEGYDSLFEKISDLIGSGIMGLKNDVKSIVKEGLRSYFWDFVHPHAEVISSLKEDDVSLKYLLLRRLGKNLSTESVRSASVDPDFKKENSHPMEFYIFPPMSGEYETGDLIRENESGKYFVILTPSCDLIERKKGRTVEKILLIHTMDFYEIPEIKKLKELQSKEKEVTANNRNLSGDEQTQLKNLPSKIKEWMKPKKNERYFFLPKTPFCPPLLIDFEHKTSVSYDELEARYTVIATLDDPISLAVLAGYSRYYSRVGYRDLDSDYAYSQLF